MIPRWRVRAGAALAAALSLSGASGAARADVALWAMHCTGGYAVDILIDYNRTKVYILQQYNVPGRGVIGQYVDMCNCDTNFGSPIVYWDRNSYLRLEIDPYRNTLKIRPRYDSPQSFDDTCEHTDPQGALPR